MKTKEVIKPQNITDPAWEGFYSHLKRGIRYPAEAQRINLQGNSQIKFSLKDGNIGAISVVNKLGSGFEAEIMRMVLSYGDFKSSQDGNYSLPVSFILSGATTAKKNPKLSPVKGYKSLSKITVMSYKSEPVNANAISLDEVQIDENDVKVYDFVSVERQPGFPGGMEKFYQYLKQTVKYPVLAQNNNVQGKVFLSFIVEKNGDLADIKVERKLGGGTDEEAIRVLKGSPRWNPGIYQGKAVRVKYHIPISFSLSGGAPAGNKTGKVIGLSVTEGADKRLKLTGFGTGKDPLILVDGKKPETSINEINPNNIESIEVLKESATTLYGAAAANGVILIKTKTASKEKPKEDKKD